VKPLIHLYSRGAEAASTLQSPLLLAVRLYWGWQFAQTSWSKMHDISKNYIVLRKPQHPVSFGECAVRRRPGVFRWNLSDPGAWLALNRVAAFRKYARRKLDRRPRCPCLVLFRPRQVLRRRPLYISLRFSACPDLWRKLFLCGSNTAKRFIPKKA
jgi:hypothetical protein